MKKEAPSTKPRKFGSPENRITRPEPRASSTRAADPFRGSCPVAYPDVKNSGEAEGNTIALAPVVERFSFRSPRWYQYANSLVAPSVAGLATASFTRKIVPGIWRPGTFAAVEVVYPLEMAKGVPPVVPVRDVPT